MPKLPECDRVVVDPAKVRDYLLSSTHPIGRFKAVFFRSLGYQESDWPRLVSDLRQLPRSNEALPGQPSPHGRKFEVHGFLVGPSGRQARVVSVWILATGEDAPRLVTVYPGAVS